MATRPMAQLLSYYDEPMSPITKAKNVLTDDGQNLQDILSDRKEDMMTPTIENSSSMFKVGQGDNVDYSENVVDGAYESCVLKGRSLVNIAKKTTYNFSSHASETDKYTVESDINKITVTINEPITQWRYVMVSINLPLLKPNTKYLVLFDGNFNGSIDIKNGDSSKPLTTGIHNSGKNSLVIETNDLSNGISNQFLYFYPTTPTSYPYTFTISNVRLLEYQEGMENWDIPYFEGLCDVKSPILTNVGKNLFNPQKIIFPTNVTNLSIEGNCVYIADGTLNGWREIQMTASLPIGTYYVDILENGNFIEGRNGLWVRGVGATMLANISNRQVFTITEPAVRIDLVIQNASNLTFNNTQYSIHIENANTAPLVHSSHEPYKSNILSFNQKDDKTIVLRSLPNGVCDTLNVETGEYVQRIGEYVISGDASEGWFTFTNSDENTVRCQLVKLDSARCANTETNMVCDKLKVVENSRWRNDEEQIERGHSDNYISIRILKSKLSSETLEGLKIYLQTNPITVQYELATPITKTVDPSGYPFAYKDGHVQLSSGSIEQSLLPTIEYSVATNRNGQVRSNQKMVERHQKELDHLQAMVLANMVETQYRQALMKLKSDLKSEVRV